MPKFRYPREPLTPVPAVRIIIYGGSAVTVNRRVSVFLFFGSRGPRGYPRIREPKWPTVNSLKMSFISPFSPGKNVLMAICCCAERRASAEGRPEGATDGRSLFARFCETWQMQRGMW